MLIPNNSETRIPDWNLKKIQNSNTIENAAMALKMARGSAEAIV